MRVLVVEDDLDLLNLLEEGLSTYGYAVDKAVNGEEAIEMAYIENYDIIILDINLPKKDFFTPNIYENSKSIDFYVTEITMY